MTTNEGPYIVMARVSDNAYKIELPGEYGVHGTFNVRDLSPYLDANGLVELGSINLQDGGIDAKVKGDVNSDVNFGG